MKSPQQRLGDAPRALDLVGSSDNLRRELAGAGDRVRTGLNVHAQSLAGSPLRPNPGRCQPSRRWLLVVDGFAGEVALVKRGTIPVRDVCSGLSKPATGGDASSRR